MNVIELENKKFISLTSPKNNFVIKTRCHCRSISLETRGVGCGGGGGGGELKREGALNQGGALNRGGALIRGRALIRGNTVPVFCVCCVCLFTALSVSSHHVWPWRPQSSWRTSVRTMCWWSWLTWAPMLRPCERWGSNSLTTKKAYSGLQHTVTSLGQDMWNILAQYFLVSIMFDGDTPMLLKISSAQVWATGCVMCGSRKYPSTSLLLKCPSAFLLLPFLPFSSWWGKGGGGGGGGRGNKNPQQPLPPHYPCESNLNRTLHLHCQDTLQVLCLHPLPLLHRNLVYHLPGINVLWGSHGFSDHCWHCVTLCFTIRCRLPVRRFLVGAASLATCTLIWPLSTRCAAHRDSVYAAGTSPPPSP